MAQYERYCSCVDFQEGWHQIISAQMLAYLHGSRYTGKTIRYCPWCGKEAIWKEVTVHTVGTSNKCAPNGIIEESKDDQKPDGNNSL